MPFFKIPPSRIEVEATTVPLCADNAELFFFFFIMNDGRLKGKPNVSFAVELHGD